MIFPGVIMPHEIGSIAGRGGDFPSEAVILLRIGCMEYAAIVLRGWREVWRFALSRDARGRQDFSGVMGKYLMASGNGEWASRRKSAEGDVDRLEEARVGLIGRSSEVAYGD